MRELEGVLEDIGQRRQNLRAVSRDAEEGIHLPYVERAAPRCRVVASRPRCVGDELGDGEDRVGRLVERAAHLRHGVAQHRGHRRMAARDQAAGGARDREHSHFEGLEGERRGLEDVAQLVDQQAKPLVLLDQLTQGSPIGERQGPRIAWLTRSRIVALRWTCSESAPSRGPRMYAIELMEHLAK